MKIFVFPAGSESDEVQVITCAQVYICEDESDAPPPTGGIPGPAGPAGAAGATGATGATGSGVAGATGATGAQGPQGAQGVPGPQGPAGPAGSGGDGSGGGDGGGGGGDTDPPPPSGQDYPTPVPPVIVPWPASGQVVMHVQMKGLQTVCYRVVWADSKMDPSKFGFVKVTEEPGSAVMGRRLTLNRNGVEKWVGVDTAPQGNLCNAPTPDTPYQVSMALNDVLDIIVENGLNTTDAPSNILIDFAAPQRY